MKRLSSKELLSLQEDCNKKLQEDFLGEACPPDCDPGGDPIYYDKEWVLRTINQWGNPFHYDLKNNKLFFIVSLGPDGSLYTVDDIRLTVNRNLQTAKEREVAKSDQGDLFAGLHPSEPWLARRRAEKGREKKSNQTDGTGPGGRPQDFSTAVSLGGGEKLSGAAYFWFFAQLMLVTACLFVIVAWFYKPREYLQEEAAA